MKRLALTFVAALALAATPGCSKVAKLIFKSATKGGTKAAASGSAKAAGKGAVVGGAAASGVDNVATGAARHGDDLAGAARHGDDMAGSKSGALVDEELKAADEGGGLAGDVATEAAENAAVEVLADDEEEP